MIVPFIREAAKKYFFVGRPLRGGGGKGLALVAGQVKKELVLVFFAHGRFSRPITHGKGLQHPITHIDSSIKRFLYNSDCLPLNFVLKKALKFD